MIDLRYSLFSNKNKKEDKILETESEGAYVIEGYNAINLELLKNLEYTYRKDSTYFNAINTYIMILDQAGHYFSGDEEAVDYLKAFFKKVDTYNGGMDEEEYIDTFARYLCIYGNFYNEFIYDSEGQIVDLTVLDPKKIDYARSSSGKIIFKNKKPIGYIEKLYLYGYEIYKNKYTAPKEVYLTTYDIYIPSDRMAHMKLFTTGDRLYGIGFIEPGYSFSKYKLNLQNNYANSALKHSSAKLVAKVGNELHEPTPTLVKNTLRDIKKTDNKSVFALPYWVDLMYLQPGSPESSESSLKYYDAQEVTATGLPAALATGAGEATNRSTLNIQTKFLMYKVKYLMRRIAKVFNKEVINPILKSAGIEGSAELKWGNIDFEELTEKAKRLSLYAKQGLITPNKDLEQYILGLEDINLKDKEMLS